MKYREAYCDKKEGKKGFVEEDFISAGLRKLREETGYVGTEVKLIGVVRPNPAFQNNFCGTILVENVRQTQDQDLDSHGKSLFIRDRCLIFQK